MAGHIFDPNTQEVLEINRPIRKFKVILGFIVSLKPVWATCNPVSKMTKPN